MNLQIFNSPDPSGKYTREKFLKSSHKEEYDYVIDYCFRNKIHGIPFKEMVYLCLNNLLCVPKCKNPNCENSTLFKNSTLGYREYCSIKCISSDPNIKKIKEKRSIEKFGTKSPAQSKEVRDKIILTNNLKYGGNSPMSSRLVKEKSRSTIVKNHGVDNPSKSKDILSRRVKSFISNIDSYKESYKKTSFDRYGVDHPWKNKDIHSKSIKFFYQNYRDRINGIIDSNLYHFLDFIKDGPTTKLVFNCAKCQSKFYILTYQFYSRINNGHDICTNCCPISSSSSLGQIDICDYIKKFYDGEVIINYKKDNKYEIDIYLPIFNMGFEYNGVFWHSDKFKNSDYHINKSEYFRKIGIQIYTIWEDDWQIRPDIVKSFIMNKIGKSNKIYARKCQIRKVVYKDSLAFLQNNHFQGDCKSSIRLGLYYNNDLVSLMAFSKPRISLGGKQGDGKYELTRFCNKNYHTVVGGASKLFSYFISNYSPIEVFSYSDNLISNGSLYKKLGFELSSVSRPGYWYLINGVREHRFNWRKSKLVKMGHSSNMTEEQIMDSLGYFRIYNGGNKKWIYKIVD